MPKFLSHLVFFAKTLSAAKNADIIFSLNAVSAGLPSLWAAKMRKKKFFVKIVGDCAWEAAVNRGKTFLLIDDFQNSKKHGRIEALHKAQVKVCKGADGVIVPSNYLANMVKNWGVPEGKIKAIYNGVDFKPLEMGKEEARKKIGIAGNVILSIGRLVSWKGFRMLIKIMPRLLEINQFFRLVIIGEGPERKTLESIIKNMRLENKVFLVGKKSREELAVFLAAAEIFVLNTVYEGFSHQILEAMALGIPIITTAVGGNREVIRQGENGFMVKYNDEFNLVEAIKTVWQAPELRERFIEEGKKTAEHFSSEKMINKAVKILTGQDE
jgi:glycosyltransferase involved in cell wall biosynthesis